jgi:hypothetical protein
VESVDSKPSAMSSARAGGKAGARDGRTGRSQIVMDAVSVKRTASSRGESAGASSASLTIR